MIISNLVRIFNALKYSWQGLKEATQGEKAFQQELMVAVFMLPIGLYFAKNTVEFCVLLGSGMLVLIVELVNSAIECAVDRIGTEHHELAGKAKDIGSAAVFLSIINAIVIWILILIL